MKLAYLMNAYPMTSTTFIRREIEAHERAGFAVDRFAIRPWGAELVDPLDIAEAKRVTYLLGQGTHRLMSGFLAELIVNPLGMARALWSTGCLLCKSRSQHWKNFAYLLEAVALKRKAIESGVDHIHTHFSTNSAAVAMLSRRLGGPKYSVTVHGPDELYELKENAVELKLRYADCFVAITNYCRDILNDFSNDRFAGKIHVVHCGLDMRDFANSTEVPDTQDLICVGRLCEAKSQTLLVQAMATIVKNHPKVRLVLIGDGDTREEIESLIRFHSLDYYVELAGWKSNADVRKALTAARALVLPSLAEGLPIVIMESLALGRPVLSTKIAGIPELVDENCGWLVTPGDLGDLIAGLNVLLSVKPEELTEMAKIGRERVLAAHDQDQTAAQLRAVFSTTQKKASL